MGFPGRKWYFKALAADSSMIWALFLIENSYAMEGNNEQSRQWLIKNYQNRDKMSYPDQIFASWAYALALNLRMSKLSI